MNIFQFGVKRPVTVLMMFVAIVGLGLVLIGRVNVDLLPEVTFPVAMVTTVYPGAGPEEVESEVTKRIEEAVARVGNMKTIRSASSESVSVVAVEFQYGTDMDAAVADIRENIDQKRPEMPKDIEAPVVVKADPSAMPIIYLALTGGESLRELRSLADEVVKREIEKIGGVASVRIEGGLERSIIVAVDPERLDAYGLSVQQVAGAIRAENLNLPAGRITASQIEYDVRTIGRFQSVAEFGRIMVGMRNGTPVYLRDIAQIEDSHKEQRTITRLDGEPCVAFLITKNTDANTVKVASAVRQTAAQLSPQLPRAVSASVLFDTSEFIVDAVDNTKAAAIEGAILAVLIIFWFLGSLRSTFIVFLSIPISVIATFLLFYFNHMTLNIVTLAGLLMAIGRIVDDSIVVLENVFRHVHRGEAPADAAVEGTREVGLAVTASTFTTVSVFLALFLVGGMIGQMFRPLALTFTFALMASLVVAMTLIPMLCSRLLRAQVSSGDPRGPHTRARRSSIFARWEEIWDGFSGRYRRTLAWALAHRWLVIAIALISLLGSLALVPVIGVTFVPKMDQGKFLVPVEAPQGSSLERTDVVVGQVERLLNEAVPEKQYVLAGAGYRGEMSLIGGATVAQEANRGMAAVSLVDKKDRERGQHQIMDAVTARLRGIPGGKFRVTELFSLTGARPFELVVKGDDLDVLASLGERIAQRLEQVPGLYAVDLDWRRGKPEYQIRVDREKAAHVGLSTATVALSLRTLLHGEDVTQFTERGEDYDITVRMPERSRQDVEDITGLMLPTPTGIQVPLRGMAQVRLGSGPTSISRKDRTRSVVVQAQTTGRPLGDIIRDVEKELAGIGFPADYTYEYAGEEEQRRESFAQLWIALLIGIGFVYVILASQFESFVHPLTIMFAIPLEVIGAIVALLITGSPISVMAMMGIIMLTGIVLSNSILLVNQILIHRDRGMPRLEAIIEAGAVRLRPILMTAMATVFAMIPMALGLRKGAELFAPLGQVVIGGLITSTALSLLAVPVIYTLLDDAGEKMRRLLGRSGSTSSPSEGR